MIAGDGAERSPDLRFPFTEFHLIHFVRGRRTLDEQLADHPHNVSRQRIIFTPSMLLLTRSLSETQSKPFMTDDTMTKRGEKKKKKAMPTEAAASGRDLFKDV